MVEEVWKEIKFDGFVPKSRYEISEDGRVKSYAYDKENGRLIKGSLVNGYRLVIFSGVDTTYKEYMHRLVAKTFLKRPSKDYKYVLHLDYKKDNNHLRNLKWASFDEHKEHSAKSPNIPKGRITYSKLSENDVVRIKKMLKRKNTRLKMIAKQFGITHTQLNRIRSGENWSHVKID